MDTRVAVLAIIVREGTSVAALNDLLHQYGKHIIGRMGVPYHQRGVNVISVAMDAPADVISVTQLPGAKACRVIVPDDQLSLAIGKEGQNARLAARLTGCKIDIKPASQAELFEETSEERA